MEIKPGASEVQMSEISPMISYFEYPLMLSIEVPPTWEVAASDRFELTFLAPVQDGYRANFGVNVDHLDPPAWVKLDNVIKESYGVQKMMFDDYKVIRESQSWIDDCLAYRRLYQARHRQTGLQFSQIQSFIVESPKHLYIVDASCLKQHEKAYIPVLERMLDSIRFIPALSTR
jgi:hypothetical protein